MANTEPFGNTEMPEADVVEDAKQPILFPRHGPSTDIGRRHGASPQRSRKDARYVRF
jgi:hypothetical protein